MHSNGSAKIHESGLTTWLKKHPCLGRGNSATSQEVPPFQRVRPKLVGGCWTST